MKTKTYGDLLKRLQKMTPEQKKQTITLFDHDWELRSVSVGVHVFKHDTNGDNLLADDNHLVISLHERRK